MGRKRNDITEAHDNMGIGQTHNMFKVRTVGITATNSWYVNADSRAVRRAKKRAEKKKK